MAKLEKCSIKPGCVHIEAGERTVCLGSKDAALGAVRNAATLGLIGLQDMLALQTQIVRLVDLPATQVERLSDGCNLPCSFVRSPMEALDAISGIQTRVHSDDVN